MATHSSTLAWKIPWTEEPGRLQSMGSLGVRHDWATSLSLFTFMPLEKEMATHSSVLAWRIPGTREPGGLPSVGSHRVRHNWSDLAAAAAAAAENFLGWFSSICFGLILNLVPKNQLGKAVWASLLILPQNEFYLKSTCIFNFCWPVIVWYCKYNKNVK